MSNPMDIHIVYSTITGTAYAVAHCIEKHLHKKGKSVLISDISETCLEIFFRPNIIIFVTSTWGDGNPNPLTLDFLERLSDKKIALQCSFGIVGCGSSLYSQFCGAVDIVATDFIAKGGTQLYVPLKIDGIFDDTIEEQIDRWLSQLVKIVDIYGKNHTVRI